MQARIALAVGLAMLLLPPGAYAADACKHRGELDTMYCDDNNDMVADAPADSKKWKNPSTIVFTYTPVEDPAVYENIFKPFTTHLAKCLDKKVVFYQVQSNAAEIEAMRSGRLHVGGFSTGPTAFAVNLAGAVASDVFHRMAERGQVKESNFRIIYRSQKFPTSSFAYAHDLDPKLVDKMLGCFYDYHFPPEMQKAFDGADRFFPINYKTTWAVVRDVAKGSGGSFDKASYEKETAREAAEAAKKK